MSPMQTMAKQAKRAFDAANYELTKLVMEHAQSPTPERASKLRPASDAKQAAKALWHEAMSRAVEEATIDEHNRERYLDLSQRATRAILCGSMTQLRVPLIPQPPSEETMREHHTSYSLGPCVSKAIGAYSMNDYNKLPKEPGVFDVAGSVGVVRDLCGQTEWTCHLGVPGDRLWGRETWNREGGHLSYLEDGDWIAAYEADGSDEYKRRRHLGTQPVWNKPETMRREDSRIDLLIRDVRVERLRSASIDDMRRYTTFAPDDNDALLYNFLVDWTTDHTDILTTTNQNPYVYVIAVDRLETLGAVSPL